ncbi:MAG: serine protease [Lachnospiraceae bacterium]|nr:serine protease [Lachnospiraceae bacterium]
MGWKDREGKLALGILGLVVSLGIGCECGKSGLCLAAGAGEMPHLIQATSLEEDYRAAAKLGLLVTRRASGKEAQEAFENVLCSCVRIQVEGYYGSGSIYRMLEDEIVIVTNRHVLQYWNEDSYVTFFNGRTSGGEVLGISKEADLGFIRIPVTGFTFEELFAFRNIRVPKELDEQNGTEDFSVEGREIFMINMASNWNVPVMTEGEVISGLTYLDDFGMEMVYAKGEAVPGMSGGGIFDSYGNYLGMLTGATLQNEIAAVPAQTICEEYNKF